MIQNNRIRIAKNPLKAVPNHFDNFSKKKISLMHGLLFRCVDKCQITFSNKMCLSFQSNYLHFL